MNIIILSSWDSSVIVPLIQKMYACNILVTAVISEPKFIKSERIHKERTEGYFNYQSIYEINGLYVPLYFVKNHNSVCCQELLKKLKPDIIINGGTPRILEQQLLDIPTIGVINSHPGMLPRYRGCTCSEWAIYNNDPVGATCHFMAAEVDAGAIILSETMNIEKCQCYEEVRANLFIHTIYVMVKGIKRVIDGNLHISDLPKQGEGIYHNVIPQDKLEIVKNKLNKSSKILSEGFGF